MQIDRRSLIVTGSLGLASFAIPGFAQTPNVLGATGFTHSVASGEPAAHSVLLWTRYVPAGGGEAKLRVELSETQDFAKVAGGAEIITGPWRDHTAKLTVAGLKPGTRYFYRFISPAGEMSPTGRTKTLATSTRKLKVAVFSCSNIGFGYFNAYGHAAVGDYDLGFHLGDYFYEYPVNTYPVKAELVPGRDMLPLTETISLADYRLRYASYRADPDLQALHAAMPMLVSMDDHESANNSWDGGAQNHTPGKEGEWWVRKAAAIQAFREWMPVSDEPWKAYDVGGLATIYRTDTRLAARSRGFDITPEMRADPALMKAYADGPWHDPAATMMGTTQEVWLDDTMRASVRAGRRWQLVGFGTNMGFQKTPPEVLDFVNSIPDWARKGMHERVAMGRAGLPQELDNWGGYPAARARFLKSVQAMGADTIVISGDSHNAWAYDLAQDGRPAAVEFGGQSVTSGGMESATRGVDPAQVAAAIVAGNPELKWADTSRRGYMAVTLTPERATNEWIFVDTIKTRDPRVTVGKTATVQRGRRRMMV